MASESIAHEADFSNQFRKRALEKLTHQSIPHSLSTDEVIRCI